jgi:hypothetical protein
MFFWVNVIWYYFRFQQSSLNSFRNKLYFSYAIWLKQVTRYQNARSLWRQISSDFVIFIHKQIWICFYLFIQVASNLPSSAVRHVGDKYLSFIQWFYFSRNLIKNCSFNFSGIYWNIKKFVSIVILKEEVLQDSLLIFLTSLKIRCTQSEH